MAESRIHKIWCCILWANFI